MLPHRKRPMMAPRLLAVTLLVAALLPTPVAAAAVAQPGTSTPAAPQPVLSSEGPNLIQNPSFETPALAKDTADEEFTDPNAFVPGWTLSGTAALVRCTDGSLCPPPTAPWPAQDGVQSVDVAKSNKTGTVTQVVPTPLGHTFTLAFYYLPGPRLIDSKSDAKINVFWAGSKLPLTLEDRQPGDRTWKYSGKVALPAPVTDHTELSFKGLAGKNFGFAIDNVSVVDDAPGTPDPDQVSAPELYRAAPTYTPPTATSGGSFDFSKLQVLGLSPNDPGTYELSFYAAASCSAMDTAGTEVATWTLTTAASDTTPVFVTPALDAAIPAATPFVAARVSGPASTPGVAGKVSGFSNCVVYGPENDTWPRALRIPLTDGTVSLGNWIDEPGIGRWFKVRVEPGGSVTVNLSSLPADYDVYLFKDIRKTYDQLVSEEDLTKLSAEFAGSGFSGSGFSGSGFSGSGFSGSGFSGSGFSADTYSGSGFSGSGFSGSGFSGSGFSGSGFSGSGFSGSGFSAEDFSAAQYYSLIGWSNNVGTANEQVGANTWTATGDFYIRVNGKDGVSSTASPFQIGLTVNSDVCNNVGPSIELAPEPIANSSDTLILTDTSRFTGDTTALTGKLDDLADATNGTVVDFASNDRVQGLEVQAGNNFACVYAKNLVASAMKDVIDAYRAGNPNAGSPTGTNLKYIVLVGGDNVIPFFRYPDTSSLAPEANFYPPVKANSTSEATLRANYVLGQDGYGSRTTITVGPVDFPVPGLAVGRLVEQPADIITMIDAYLDITPANGIRAVSPLSSLVTGYDFVADTAETVKANLDAGTGTPGNVLLQPYGKAPTDSDAWTADQLKAELATPRDITFLAGHFSADSALAADYQTVVTTSDFAALTAGQATNDIIFSIGCHSGYNTVDGDAIDGVTDPLDWAQVFAQQGITSVLGTGYQYGDTDFLEYSERIYAEFSGQLLSGTAGTPLAIGKALVASKIAYLQQTNDIGDLHLKSLLEAGLYGLPMLGVDFAHGRTGNPPAGSPSVTLTAAATGLRYTDLHQVTLSTAKHKDLLNGDTSDPSDTLTSTWYEGNAGVRTEPGAPALPLYTEDVTPDIAGYVLRGVGFRAGAFTDIASIVPLSGAPATELQTSHTSFNSPVFYPNTMWSANHWGVLTGGSQTTLLTTPAQHKAIDPGSPYVQLRLYDSLDLRLFYINSNASGIKALAPVVNGVTSNLATGNVSARVIGDSADGAGIHAVWITYTTPDSGTWGSFDLAQDTTDTAIWRGNRSLPAGTLYMVQAVNTAGTITLNDNFGAYYLWGVADSDLAPTTLALTGPTSATYGNTATITATLKSNGSPVDGKVSLTLGSVTRSGKTGSDGTVDIDLPVSSAAGTYPLVGAYLGDPAAGYQSSGTARSFTIDKAASKVTVSCPASVDYTGSAQEPCTARVTGVAANPLDDLDQPVLVTYTGNTAPGTATASAVFYGDAAHTGDTSSTTFSIAKATQAITFDALANRTYGDPTFTVRATADSGLTVTFSTLTTTACTVTPAGEVAIVGAGTCTITASQAGDPTYAAAADVSQSFTISPATATLSFVAADLSQTYDGSPRSVGVTTTPTDLGTVTVTYTGISPTVYATSETAPTGAGSYTVSASLTNANYTATPVTGTLVISKASTSTSITCPTTATTYTGSPIEPCTATVTGAGGLNGSVTVSYLDNVNAGTATADATYDGDANHTGSTATQESFTISPATATLSFVAADLSQTYDGSPRSVGVTTTPTDLGTVTVTYTGISPTVYATSETAPTGAGSYTVSASLTNANYTATPISGTLVVAKKAQTITFAALTNRTYGDPAFTVSATADSGLTVTFSTSTTTVCTVTSAGVITIVGAGTCTITASQAGDSNYQAAPSVAQSFQVVRAFVRAEYTGDWFMYAGTAPRFSAMVYPAAAPDTGTTVTTIDYVAQGVTARVKVYPAADCGMTCDTATPAWQTTTPVPVTNGTGGVGTVETFGPSTLSDGAYIVVVELVLNNNLLGARAVAAFGVTPSTATYVVGGGAIPTANGSNNPDNTKGYFGFNVRKQKNSATGSMAFVYRQRINPTTGQPCSGNLTSSTTSSTSCRDVDVMIRTTSVTSASTTQSSTWPVTGTATGKVTIRFVDAISGTTYAGLSLSNHDFRFDAYDAAPGGIADRFGLTVYRALKPAVAWYYSAAGTASGQTGTAAATTLTTISLGDISAPPGNR